MKFDCIDKKPLLFADLFKPHKTNTRNLLSEKDDSVNIMPPTFEGPSSSSSLNLSSFCDSSSSGFSTPFESELGSSEGEDGDFIAELTRQMAERMLQEEEEEGDDEEKEETVSSNDTNSETEVCSPVKKNQMHMGSASAQNLINGFYSNPFSVEDPNPQLQVYELRHQPPLSKQGPVSQSRRFKGTESTQPKRFHKTEHHYMQQYRGREWANGFSGSGMQAVFLGGSGYRNGSGSTGTGVFLPRVANDPTQTKKKPGCSTVLIPTRVLQALELHFSRFSDSSAPPLSAGSIKDDSNTSKGQPTGQFEVQNQIDDEMQLPQEWTY